MRWLVLSIVVLWIQPVSAQGLFTEGWSGVCTLGTQASAGCDSVRARETLDAGQAPWHGIGRVNFAGRDQRSHCTGTLVSDRLVLTAAHCLYNAPRKRWIQPSAIRFAAGYQRGQAAAVSGVTGYRLHPDQAVDGAFDNRADLDWAFLELSEPLGQQLGFFPVTAARTPEAYVAGYPGVRPHILSRTFDCMPRLNQGGILLGVCPVMMGDSGAPLLVDGPEGPRVTAILSRVAATPDGVTAVFLSNELFELSPD